jgi:hypothetical protein
MERGSGPWRKTSEACAWDVCGSSDERESVGGAVVHACVQEGRAQIPAFFFPPPPAPRRPRIVLASRVRRRGEGDISCVFPRRPPRPSRPTNPVSTTFRPTHSNVSHPSQSQGPPGGAAGDGPAETKRLGRRSALCAQPRRLPTTPAPPPSPARRAPTNGYFATLSSAARAQATGRAACARVPQCPKALFPPVQPCHSAGAKKGRRRPPDLGPAARPRHKLAALPRRRADALRDGLLHRFARPAAEQTGAPGARATPNDRPTTDADAALSPPPDHHPPA